MVRWPVAAARIPGPDPDLPSGRAETRFTQSSLTTQAEKPNAKNHSQHWEILFTQ